MKKPILERRVAVEMGIIEVGEMFASYMQEGCGPEYDGTPLGDARAEEDERRLGKHLGSDLFREIAEEADDMWDEGYDPLDESWDEDPIEETPRERALVEYLRDSNWTPDNFPIVSWEEFGLE